MGIYIYIYMKRLCKIYIIRAWMMKSELFFLGDGSLGFACKYSLR